MGKKKSDEFQLTFDTAELPQGGDDLLDDIDRLLERQGPRFLRKMRRQAARRRNARRQKAPWRRFRRKRTEIRAGSRYGQKA